MPSTRSKQPTAKSKMSLVRGTERGGLTGRTRETQDANWLGDFASTLLAMSERPCDDTIIDVLHAACQLCAADKTLFFQLSKDGKFFNRTLSSQKTSPPTRKRTIEQVPVATIKWLVQKLSEESVLTVNSLNSLPEDAFALRAILETRGSKAIICSGVFTNGRLRGIVGCARSTEGKAWTELDRAVVQTVAETLAKKPVFEDELMRANGASGNPYSKIFSQSLDPYLVADRNGTPVWMNDACATFLSLDSDAVQQEKYNILLDSGIHESGFDEIVEQVFHEGKSARLSIDVGKITSRKGLLARSSVGSIELTLFPLNADSGKLEGVVVCLRDITGNEEQMSHLRSAEERFRLIFSNSREMIIVAESCGKVLMANPSCLEFFGFCPSELKEFTQRVHPDDRSMAKRAMDRIVRSGNSVGDFQCRCENTKGAFTHFETSVSRIDTPERAYLLLQARDITSRMLIEEELKATNERLAREEQVLEEKNSALREILRQIGDEKEQIKRQIQSNVDRLIVPVLQTLYERSDTTDKSYLRFLESCLNDITSPFINRLEKLYTKLSPREVEICKMIKSGFSSKDIANTLNISLLTVHKFRQQIRHKLGVSNKQVNLVGLLNSM